MEQILEKARLIAEAAEVFMVTSEETPVHFEANRLKAVQNKQSRSVSLRIVKDGKLGYATTTDPADSQSLVASAVETAQFGMPAQFELPAPTEYPVIDVYDPAIETLATERMIALGEEIIARITDHTPEVICEGEVTKVIVLVRLINSAGGEVSYRKSVFGVGFGGTLIRGTDMLFIGESRSSGHPVLDPETVTKTMLRQLELAREPAQTPSRQMPVIFTPEGVAGALIPPLMAAFSGKTVLEGASPIGSKRGKPVFDKKLSLWDDPTLPYCPQSRPADDEGTPSQRTPLIENGTVAGFLYDLQTAAMANTASTANGGRGYGGLVAPAPSAFTITPGDTTFEEMIQDIKEGLVVEHLMGAEQGNILGGDFSGNVLLGYKIENGKIVGRVKNTIVAGNIYQVLKSIAAIGKEAKWVGSHVYTPPIYCPSLSVASK